MVGCGLPAAVRNSAAQLTLVSRPSADSLDMNGFLLDPRWVENDSAFPDVEERCRFRVGSNSAGARMLRIGRYGCSSQLDVLTINEATDPVLLGIACASNDELGLVRGHVNWFPITVSGRLYWKSYEGGAIKDHDVTMWLVGPTGSPLTRGNSSPFGRHGPKAFELEFNLDETIGRLPARAPGYWSRLRSAILSASDSAGRLLDGRPAIVTGLFGVDGIHQFQAELHPVYAMAVLLSSRYSDGRTLQEWALMVRDRGNEGECASGVLPMYSRFTPGSVAQMTYTLDLGWLVGASSVTVEPNGEDHFYATDTLSKIRTSQSAPRFQIVSGKHVLISIAYARPTHTNDDVLVLGDFSITWAGAPSSSIMTALRRVPPPAATSNERGVRHPTRAADASEPGNSQSRAPEGYWVWDELVPEPGFVVAPDAPPPAPTPKLDSVPVAAIPTVRGGRNWCGDAGWAKSPSCWPQWRIGLFAGYQNVAVVPLYFPPHSDFHRLVGRIPLLGYAFLPTAIRLELGADRQRRDSSGARAWRASARLAFALPTFSQLNRQVIIGGYPIGAFGMGYDFNTSKAVGVLSYGAGLSFGRPGGRQVFLEWRHTKYGGAKGDWSIDIGLIRRPPSHKPWCPSGKTCPSLPEPSR